MASVIIVVIIFVLLALAILFICQNGTKTGILINKYNFREALPMKADKYRFGGARTCDLRALSCDDKEDAPGKDEIPAKTAEKLQKMTALEAER